MDESDLKAVLTGYLQDQREALLWKVEGLSERELRMPRTPTGTNLIGIVKHLVNTEIWYFGDCFGREWPTPGERIAAEDLTDPQADWYLTEEETSAGVIELYRRVWAFADATIRELPMDAPGRVPWWGDEQVTLGQVMVHVLVDLTRHVGHADILREGVDGNAGLLPRSPNLPELDRRAYVEKLTALADMS